MIRRDKVVTHGWPWMQSVQCMQVQRMAYGLAFKPRSEVVRELGYDSERMVPGDNHRPDGH